MSLQSCVLEINNYSITRPVQLIIDYGQTLTGPNQTHTAPVQARPLPRPKRGRLQRSSTSYAGNAKKKQMSSASTAPAQDETYTDGSDVERPKKSAHGWGVGGS